MRVTPSLLVGLCAGAVTLTSAGAARAWYFPEHIVIAHDGLEQLPPELRDILRDAVARARADGLRLCERVDVSIEDVAQAQPLQTRMLHAERGAGCVPYAALSALAGDHANSAAELRTVLTSQKGIELTSAAAFEWSRFRAALERLPNASLERMAFVHALDVAFYFINPGYELRAQATQAHFADSGRPIDEVVGIAAATGSVETALGQFLAHHLRSLQLASRGTVTEALLEHAFAMHFLQDAFAAGHLVMTEETWKNGNASARRRHDFYNAKGLAVGHALGVTPCPALGAGSLELSGLPPCWVTSGDGYLGTSPDASDRLHAALAATQAELEMALALNPIRAVAAVEAYGQREQLALGQLLEPTPWWTVSASDRHKLQESAGRTVRLVRAAAAAVDRLKTMPLMRAVEVGSPRSSDLFDRTVLADALDPCKPREDVDPSFVDDTDVAPCGPSRAPGLGTVGVSLLRPILVEWPASQVDASTLEGVSKEDLGWAAQLLASANASVLVPPHAPVDFFAPSLGVSAGVSYRWGTYLPGRLNRSLAELNVGISESLHVDARGNSGGNPARHAPRPGAALAGAVGASHLVQAAARHRQGTRGRPAAVSQRHARARAPDQSRADLLGVRDRGGRARPVPGGRGVPAVHGLARAPSVRGRCQPERGAARIPLDLGILDGDRAHRRVRDVLLTIGHNWRRALADGPAKRKEGVTARDRSGSAPPARGPFMIRSRLFRIPRFAVVALMLVPAGALGCSGGGFGSGDGASPDAAVLDAGAEATAVIRGDDARRRDRRLLA